MMNNETIKGIYLHIPFCQSICNYCDFPKVFYNKTQADLYLEQLINEINSYDINATDIESIYIGGGTPSVLSEEQLTYLFDNLRLERFTNLKEFSIEVNPESLTSSKIKLFQKYGLNRISMGVQTFNDDLLKHLNRQHNQELVINKIKQLQNNGFSNISIDLMIGLENQSLEMVYDDLKIIEQLKIPHISYYNLIIEKGTVFYNQNYPEQDNYYQEEVSEYLEKIGFQHYEVSNYALNNKYSKHNLLYWLNERYYGFGLGAGGFINNYRYYNTKSISEYLKGNYLLDKDYYENKSDYLKDEVMLNFRIFNGIDLSHYQTKYNLDFKEYFKDVIISNKEMLNIKDNKLFISEKGKRYLNDLIIDFMDVIDTKENEDN